MLWSVRRVPTQWRLIFDGRMKSNCTIFLIDDDTDDQEIFALALAEIDNSFTCVTAKNGFEAIDKLTQTPFRPDYIFLDLNMPRMNGKQCLLEIKKQRKLTDIPVVIYTTSSERRDKDETIAMGAAAFITKPPQLGDLIHSLKKIFVHLD